MPVWVVNGLLLATLLLSLAACAPPPPLDRPLPALATAVWTGTPSSPAPPTTATPILASPTPAGWTVLVAGIERREVAVPIEGAAISETLILFRLDPAQVAFRVHYTPGRAEAVADWARRLSQPGEPPLLVVNAGFFTELYRSAAFTVADGRAEGSSYHDYGGMFYVQGGTPRVRSLTLEPWRPDEELEQAVQGTPVLVRPGRTPYKTTAECSVASGPCEEARPSADAQRSRRTAIAQTAGGSIVVIVAPHYRLTLVELAQALLAPELDLAIALNLDGGSSTGYWAGWGDNLDSDKPVPSVIAVYSK